MKNRLQCRIFCLLRLLSWKEHEYCYLSNGSNDAVSLFFFHCWLKWKWFRSFVLSWLLFKKIRNVKNEWTLVKNQVKNFSGEVGSPSYFNAKLFCCRLKLHFGHNSTCKSSRRYLITHTDTLFHWESNVNTRRHRNMNIKGMKWNLFEIPCTWHLFTTRIPIRGWILFLSLCQCLLCATLLFFFGLNIVWQL